MTSAATRAEANDLKELIDVCREYVTAIRVKQVTHRTYLAPYLAPYLPPIEQCNNTAHTATQCPLACLYSCSITHYIYTHTTSSSSN